MAKGTANRPFGLQNQAATLNAVAADCIKSNLIGEPVYRLINRAIHGQLSQFFWM